MKKFDVQHTDGGLIHFALDEDDKFAHKAKPTSCETPLTVLQHVAELHELFRKAEIEPLRDDSFQFLLLAQLVYGRTPSIDNN